MSLPNLLPDAYGQLIDLTNQESYRFDWNPTEFEEGVAAEYSRQMIPGLSHKRSQFLSTTNREINFTLVLDGLVHGGPAVVEKVRQFLLSTVYPRSSKRTEGAGAPKMLLILPGTFRSKGFIDSVKIVHRLYYRDMKIRKFEATIKFMEELDKRTTSQEVRNATLADRRTGNFIDFRNAPPFSTKKRGYDFSNSPAFSTRTK